MKIEKIRPLATIEHRWNDDGREEWYEIDYECPNCRKHLSVGDIACDVCSKCDEQSMERGRYCPWCGVEMGNPMGREEA